MLKQIVLMQILEKPSIELGIFYLQGERSNHETTMPLDCDGDLIIKEPFLYYISMPNSKPLTKCTA